MIINFNLKGSNNNAGFGNANYCNTEGKTVSLLRELLDPFLSPLFHLLTQKFHASLDFPLQDPPPIQALLLFPK